MAPIAFLDAVMFLVAHGLVETAQDDKTAANAKHRTDLLNRHLIDDDPEETADIALASPVTGGGVVLAASERRILQALQNGERLNGVSVRE